MFPLINKRETGKKLRAIMELKNITVKDIQKYLGLACVQSIYHWFEGISIPTIDNLYALSELFQVPIDEMICGNRKIEEQYESSVCIIFEECKRSGVYDRLVKYMQCIESE